MECKSSFIIQPYHRKYLKPYYDRMSQDNLTCLWDDNVASVLEEQGYYAQDAPRSVYEVDKLYQALAKYEPSAAPQCDIRDVDVIEGIRLAYTCFARPRKTQPLELPAFTPRLVLSITSNRTGSAGLTAWGQTKAESYVRAYERGIQQIKGEKRPDPCIAFKRTQFNGKTRLVWGYPYAMTALEGIFARPLIDHFKKVPGQMAFGMSTGELGSRLRVASRHNEWAYSTDVSSYDSSIPASLIAEAFKILKTWFKLSQVEPTSQVSYSVIWDQIVNYFIHTPIVMPNGNVYKGKKHGVPSGSYFTQMIDSIVNVIVVGAISHHFNLYVSKEDIFVLGDDILFWSDRNVALSHIADYATQRFGMKFNESKSSKFHWNETIHYLGRDWNGGIPTLSQEEVLKRMTQPENFRKYPKNPAERARTVRLLILSYASVYRSAHRIYKDIAFNGSRWFITNASTERDFTRPLNSSHGYQVDPDYLTGLQRYQLKYLGQSDKLLGGNVPIALQFWK